MSTNHDLKCPKCGHQDPEAPGPRLGRIYRCAECGTLIDWDGTVPVEAYTGTALYVPA